MDGEPMRGQPEGMAPRTASGIQGSRPTGDDRVKGRKACRQRSGWADAMAAGDCARVCVLVVPQRRVSPRSVNKGRRHDFESIHRQPEIRDSPAIIPDTEVRGRYRQGMSLGDRVDDVMPLLWFAFTVAAVWALAQSGLLGQLLDRLRKFGVGSASVEFTEDSAKATRQTITGSTRLSVVDGLGFCELGW